MIPDGEWGDLWQGGEDTSRAGAEESAAPCSLNQMLHGLLQAQEPVACVRGEGKPQLRPQQGYKVK